MKSHPHVLSREEFPRSSRYDPDWVMDNQMGPNVLWLTEWLSQELVLAPGMKVLDLGCGKALSSIFLAREFGVQVWAADLWVSPDDNWRRVQDVGIQDRVYPLRAEAHALSFPGEFFDLVVSVDAYHYFGTDDLYLGYLTRFLRSEGQIGVVVPGLTRALPGGEIPAHLKEPQKNGKVFWEDECSCFHTAQWWRESWSRSCLSVRVADTMEEGWRHWRDFELAVEKAGKALFPSDAEALDRDRGETLGFVRLVATRRPAVGPNLYDPALLSSLPGPR